MSGVRGWEMYVTLQNVLTTQHYVCMHVCAFMFIKECTLGYHVLPSALFGAQQSAHAHQLGPGVHYICSCSCVASQSAASPVYPVWDVCSSCSLFTRNTQEKGCVPLWSDRRVFRDCSSSFGKCTKTQFSPVLEMVQVISLNWSFVVLCLSSKGIIPIQQYTYHHNDNAGLSSLMCTLLINLGKNMRVGVCPCQFQLQIHLYSVLTRKHAETPPSCFTIFESPHNPVQHLKVYKSLL